MKDGVSWHCNRCNYHEGPEQVEGKEHTMDITAVNSFPSLAIEERKIRKDTCAYYGVKMGMSEATGEVDSHYYPITKGGKVSGYKVRKLPKEFYSIGDSKGQIELFGQAVIPKGGKKLVITGGELDALATFQILYDKYPNFKPSVVSLPKGENASAVKDNLDYVMSFAEVIIYTDMDEPGRKCAEEIAALIGPHKSRIMSTSEKDACDMLKAGKQAEFINAFFSAEKHKPKGIFKGSEILLEDLKKPSALGYDTPYPILNQKLEGLRKGELTILTAGTGVGKSTLAREIGYHLRAEHDLSVGNLFLEEPKLKTLQGYIALDNNIPLFKLRKNPKLLSDEQWENSYNKLIANKWFGFDHFGSLPTEELMDRMRYLVYGEGCDFILLDHLSLVFSGQKNENERMAIDNALTELAGFINESGVGVICVVHLSRNKIKGSFNEGAPISLSDLRGSGALEQLSWNVLGLERDQSSEEKDISKIKILKSREVGWVGHADTCEYNPVTGRLLPIELNLSGY